MTTADTTNIQRELRLLIADICAYEPEEIEADALLFDDLGLDSISLLDVFVSMSRTYAALRGITPGEVDIDETTTYADLEAVLAQILAARAEGLAT